MLLHRGRQAVAKLPKEKGGYFYLKLAAAVVARFPKGKATRLLCTIGRELQLQSGLNHLGDGDFFIIIAGRHLKALGAREGDMLAFTLEEDPDPLGVPIPEAVAALLESDEELRRQFEAMTPGGQRTVVHAVSRIKDFDRQVQSAIAYIRQPPRPGRKKG